MIQSIYSQAVFADLLLLNVPILRYKHRCDRIMDSRVMKEMAVMEPFRSTRFTVESLAELHYFLEGALQENITAPKRIEISRRNLQASRQRYASVCSGNGGDLPAE